MARRSALLILATIGLLAAQIRRSETVERRLELTAAAPAQGWFLAAIEAVDARVIRGAPFSARARGEWVRLLADGTRIVQRSEVALWRDRDGRSRREFVAASPEAAPPGERPPTAVVLYEPGAGTVWIVEPAEKLARRIRVSIEGGVQAAAGEPRQAELIFPAPAVSLWMEQRFGAGAAAGFGGAFGGARLLRFGPEAGPEDLGEQVIEGLKARGARYTEVIPAGRIGNDRPITILHERWMAPELGLVVAALTQDPLGGDVTYRLSEIRRGDPPAELFEVPSDYRIEEAGSIRRRVQLVEETAAPAR